MILPNRRHVRTYEHFRGYCRHRPDPVMPPTPIKHSRAGRSKPPAWPMSPELTAYSSLTMEGPTRSSGCRSARIAFRTAGKAVKLGASVVDLEGITTDGTQFYVVGSQSKSKGGDLTGLVRFRFRADGRACNAVETVRD